jgi:hypothetical protein
MTMKNLILRLALALIFLAPVSARAQTTATVVAVCGTLPLAYIPGTTRPITQDITGTLCSIAGGGGGGGAITIADGADVTQGAIADAASSAGGTGTLSAKLRLVTTQLGTLNTSLGTINTTLGTPLQAGGAVNATLAAETTKVIGTIRIASGGVASGALASGSVASGAMVDLGSQADAACGTDNGTCSAIALIKRGNQTATTTATAVQAAIPAGTNPIGAIFGPTADGSAASTAPVLTAGTTDGTATGAVAIPKISAGGLVSTDGSAVTQPVSAASLPLPTGAATAAKQPALGTAGTSSTDVITVQGIASGTPQPTSQSGTWTVQPGNTANTTAWKVDGSAVTQPVSGTVTGNGAANVTATDCSGTITSGGTAQNAFTAQTTLHGFTIANVDTGHNAEVLWISFTTTAAASSAGSYPLPAPTATTFAGFGSFTTPPGFGTNHAVSIIGATTGHVFSCTWW